MFITRESDYAIRVIRALADGEIKTVHEICAVEKVPKQFAYKILKKLERGELVKIQRGAHGGYRLFKDASEITLHCILTSVADNLYVNECLKEGISCERNQEQTPCFIHKECRRLEEIIMGALQERNMMEILDAVKVN